MTMRYLQVVSLVLCLIFCLGVAVQSAEPPKIDSDALTDELQKFSPDSDQLTMVWWMPEEYWNVILTEDGDVSQAEVEEILDLVAPYVVLMVVDGKIGPMGGITYRSDAEVRASLKIKDSQGNAYAPLAEDTIGDDLKLLHGTLKPVLEGMLGPMGKNMRPYYFSNKDKSRKRIADATVPGSFTVMVDKQEYKWRLPLASLTPPKTCPKCGEKLNGTYNYCPWDGTKLPEPSK